MGTGKMKFDHFVEHIKFYYFETYASENINDIDWTEMEKLTRAALSDIKYFSEGETRRFAVMGDYGPNSEARREFKRIMKSRERYGIEGEILEDTDWSFVARRMISEK